MSLDARNALADLDTLLELQALGPAPAPPAATADCWTDPVWIAAWLRAHPAELARAIEAQRAELARAAEVIATDRDHDPRRPRP